ncbi:hypothetical protein [Lysobacter enzymogenes]|uniref:hypothetical protein n=1 Tax=Lysobacter enzymogenes TaxID=69 RepID=UPI000898A5EF|nr:hypothetical protein [Lysobacter enzymogenes]SDX97470.1 hypothetical protein SAMN05421681_109223 [Lysobacter enzymogenes]
MQVSQDERAVAFPGRGAQRKGTAPTRQASDALPRAAALSIEQVRAARPVPQVRTEARLGTAAPPLVTTRSAPVMAAAAETTRAPAPALAACADALGSQAFRSRYGLRYADTSVSIKEAPPARGRDVADGAAEGFCLSGPSPDALARQAGARQQCLRSPAASAAGIRDLCGVAARRPGLAHRSAVVAHGCADLAAAPARADRVVRARFAERGYGYGARSRSLGVSRSAHGIELASTANARGSSAGSIKVGLRTLLAAARGRNELGGPVPGTALLVLFAIERLPHGNDAHRARSLSEQDNLPIAPPRPGRVTPPRRPAGGRAWWRPA